MMESNVWVDGQSPIMWPFKLNEIYLAMRSLGIPAFYELIMLNQHSDWLVLLMPEPADLTYFFLQFAAPNVTGRHTKLMTVD